MFTRHYWCYEQGCKEFVDVEDAFRESSASWKELMESLRARGLKEGPKLAIGDGAMGFWKALTECFPKTVHQRCWVHKTANVLNALPKSVQPKEPLIYSFPKIVDNSST